MDHLFRLFLFDHAKMAFWNQFLTQEGYQIDASKVALLANQIAAFESQPIRD